MDEQKKTSGSLALNSTPRVITIAPSTPVRDRKLRVAAYARVSSRSEDQLNSFAAQNAHYTELITDNPEWEFVDVYADKGITGTSAEKRDDFQRLLADCRRGRVDKILVKSSSRFARNAKECLETVRELKALGVGVCFEEQGIDTSELAGEFLTAIFAMMDQKESENISDNLRWSIDMRMRAGKYNTCTAPFGYRLVKGKLELIPEQVPIIRYIYEAYLSGKTAGDIAAALNLFSKGKLWKPQRIDYILTNERYSGNAFLRKRYTTDTLPRKIKYNHGQKPMYFVEGINEAAISQEVFNKAQELRRRRGDSQVPGIAGQRPLANGWLYCGCCGKALRPKCINRKWYMACRGHEESTELCDLLPIAEEAVVSAVFHLYYKLRHQGGPSYTTSSYQLSASNGRFTTPSSSQSVSLTERKLLNTDEVRRVKRPYQIITSRDHPAMMYAPDLSKWLFNQMLGMGDMEHNRKLREERENKRPVITDTKQEIALWNIWVYYQKDIMRRLAQQKNAGGGASDDE